MVARNVTPEDLRKALEVVNVRFEGNLCLKSEGINPQGSGWRFGLTVVSSKGPGSRISPSVFQTRKDGTPRRISAACWHAHGWYFEALFERCPDAIVKVANRVITRDGGNWVDWNIGSPMYPMSYSDACDCNEDGERDLAHHAHDWYSGRAIV
jgi:hypothetical protein